MPAMQTNLRHSFMAAETSAAGSYFFGLVAWTQGGTQLITFNNRVLESRKHIEFHLNTGQEALCILRLALPGQHA